MEAVRNTWEIVKREWKGYFASPVAYVFLVVFLLLSGFLTFMVGRFYEAGEADLRGFFAWYPWVYLLLVPAVSMRLWSEERRVGTIELLLTLPVTMTQALLGKFLAAWLFIIVAVALSFPIVLTTAWLGNPDSGVILGGYVGAVLLAGTYLSVGLFTSAMTKNQVVSFVIALMICLFLVLAGWPPVTNMLVLWAPDSLVRLVASFGVMPHYESIQRGVLDIRDIGYYLSAMAVMLFATHQVLESRKSA